NTAHQQRIVAPSHSVFALVKTETENSRAAMGDESVQQFLTQLATERGASIYTQRNYQQVLGEFCHWFETERQHPPSWPKLERDDFRSYLRFLGRSGLSRAAIQLRFSALRSFYKFLIRRGGVEASPIKNILLPKPEKRLPKFLTVEQMAALLHAPVREF